jgi:pyruvate,orthophosphate dikinase
MYISFHSGVALHEIGHFLTAAKLNALNDKAQREADAFLQGSTFRRMRHFIGLFVLAPYGKASGIKREGLNYYPDAPFNLAVAAAGPHASRNVALVMLPPALLLLTVGLILDTHITIYVSRLLLGIGVVSLLDFLLADPGKYADFKVRERRAQEKAATVTKHAAWWDMAPAVRHRMLDGRIQKITHPRLGTVSAPWQFRNCGMGGRHTEKEYPESNVSMQEAMFLILSARNYQEAQEMTVRLQNRLKEIIEKEEGCRVMGIGLEGGVAPYIERGTFPLPEVRLWMMMKQTITECGYSPGVDVAIALDPAMTELEIAYRTHFKVPDNVGMYLFWRDKALTVMDRDSVLDLYIKAIQEHDIPILSIEDGFSEDDHEGWKKLLAALGDRLFVIGDDLITTNDLTIEVAAAKGMINTALIKANQIGSLYETILAMLVALGKGLDLVVSHRSKSPNDDMEAQIALAVNSLGLKAGGGANTERLVKYSSVTELMQKGGDEGTVPALDPHYRAVIRHIYAFEEPTNAGIPTVGATVEFSLPEVGVHLKFHGATPLGTSAGSGEAIHLVDSVVEGAEYRELLDSYPDFFHENEPGVYSFSKDVKESEVIREGNETLTALFTRTQRYDGKGCLNAVDNIAEIIAPAFVCRNASSLTLQDIDNTLLSLELHVAQRRGKAGKEVDPDERVRLMQRKQNIGMNAMLSVSLALARGIAHLKGKDLFELLREEMLSIIQRTADTYEVEIRGSQFSDYVEALREVNKKLEAQGKPLYSTLREITGIYDEMVCEKPAPIPIPEPHPIQVPEAALEVLAAVGSRLGRSYRKNAHHGYQHTKDLFHHAVDLVEKLHVGDEMNWRVLAASVCLHDVDVEKENHGHDNAEMAREILTATNMFDEEEITRAEKAIRFHEDRTREGAEKRRVAGLEAQILYDADQIEAFGIKGIYRYAAIYAERGRSFHQILDDAQVRYQSMTFDEARTLASSEFAYTQTFFEKWNTEGGKEEGLHSGTGVLEWIRSHQGLGPIELANEALAVLSDERESPGRSISIDFFRTLREVYEEDREEAETVPTPGPSPEGLARLTEEEEEAIAAVNKAIFRAYHNEANPVVRKEALLHYVAQKLDVTARTGRFGIVNNRIFRDRGRLIIPYMIADTLLVQSVTESESTTIFTNLVLSGTILTDELIKQFASSDGEPIDLEKDLFDFSEEAATSVQVARIRNMADQLRKINQSVNRNESVYVLMILAARLSVFSFKKYLSAKNLQSEVQDLLQELVKFLNTPLSNKLSFLVRILVRNIAGVVAKPKLIDRLWNDTIDLAEIYVRGSDIVNEIRRSTHHAVGKRTLLLVGAYRDYLENGDVEGLSRMGYPEPASADKNARELEQPKKIVSRIVEDLEELLGSSDVHDRIREWQTNYETKLIECGFGKSLLEEVEEAVTSGIHRSNKWVFYHHLRIIRSRVRDFHKLPSGAGIERRLNALLKLEPDSDTFDPVSAESELRGCVDEFIRDIRLEYQDRLFEDLELFLTAYNRNEFIKAVTGICDLRKAVRDVLFERAFPEQRLRLFEFDCLLEEIGYLALRHIAWEYEEKGVDIPQSLALIRSCILNFTHDGFHSRQLLDLSGMLMDDTKTYAETENIIEQIQRNYHHILQRFISPFEKMRERLGLDDEEFRTSVANMQRYLHDLNNMAYFCDLVRSYIEDHVTDPCGRIDGKTDFVPDDDSWDIIHLSHQDKIKRKVESGDVSHSLRDRYGGKGSGLIYISYLNIPTRDAFILPSTLPRQGLDTLDGGRLESEILEHLRILEEDISAQEGIPRKFADPECPLLLAVRGGAVFSMPGVLSTVLFVGMNDEIADAMARVDPWHAYDSYRRFLASYGQAVWGIDIEKYSPVDDTKLKYGVKYKYDLSGEGMREVVESTKSIIRERGFGEELDEILSNPEKQLLNSIRAVFDSWNNETVRRYREIKGICDTWQTAAIIQQMAFGNRRNETIRVRMDETRSSLTGVISRTQVTNLGMRDMTGDFKFSAAGDDLVGGLTTSYSFQPIKELESYMPFLTRRLKHTVAKLRRFMGTDQEIEFTVERGMLSILQSRAAEIGRNKEDVSFEDPGNEAIRGIGVRGGAFRGIVAFDETDMKNLAGEDLTKREDVDGIILLLENPTPEDIPLIISADGLLASKGGSTSHAAVAINTISHKDYNAVMSASNLRVNTVNHEALIVDKDGALLHRIQSGDIISIQGSSGAVYVGSRGLKHI